MKFIFLLSLGIINIAHSYAQIETLCEKECSSQLVRMSIDNSSLENLLGNNQTQSILLPQIENLLKSDIFKQSFIKDYPLEPMPFPFNSGLCKSEKQKNNPRYQDVDCSNLNLCTDSTISTSVKSELCFSIPCSLIKGSINMKECASDDVARPQKINFTSPVRINNIDLTPTQVTRDGKTIKGCFTVDQLDTSFGVDVEFMKNSDVTYENIGLSELNIKLDSPREICMSAIFDPSGEKPLHSIKIEHVSGKDFVSDEMINKSVSGAKPSGLTGYSPETLSILKVSLLPPLGRYMRPAIENAIASALSTTFETQLGTLLKKSGEKEVSVTQTPSDAMISEIGVSNMAFKKYVEIMKCSITKAKGETIKADAPCLNFMKLNEIPSPEKGANLLLEKSKKYEHLTSESIRKELTALEPEFRKLNLQSVYKNKIQPVIATILTEDPNSPLSQGIKVLVGINEGKTNVGVSVPKICNTEEPSTYEGRSITGCPIEVYVDLNEVNRLLDSMYTSGRLCHKGSGDYVPERNAKGNQVYNADDSPRGRGCLFAIEDTDKGMRCYLDGAPKISYNSKLKQYGLKLKTRDCFRGPVVAGQGKIGGDVLFDIKFKPDICDGDFCINDATADWSVTPGTARFALKESSFLNGIVRKNIDKQLQDVLKQSIRVPLANGGPLANVPLTPDGRSDQGPGYFGACLELK